MHFCEDWAKTDAGENFLLVEDDQGDSKIVIFSTEHNLELLAQAEKIYVDGTFQICPRVFYQFFSLHAFKNGRHAVPLSLLSSAWKIAHNLFESP